MNLFERLDENNGSAKRSFELAKMTGTDPYLMGRSWRCSSSIITHSVADVDHLSRSAVKASGSDGKYL